MSDAATLAYYQAQAPRLALSSAQAPSPHLDGFLDLLRTGDQVLELGCGTGRDAARIAERGFALDTTDAAPAMVRKTKERFGIDARIMAFAALDAVEVYDAVWAHACLMHVRRSNLPKVIGRIHSSLRPGGWHFANYPLGPSEVRDLQGRWHNRVDLAWITDLYVRAGFSVVRTQIDQITSPNGGTSEWIALTLRNSVRTIHR